MQNIGLMMTYNEGDIIEEVMSSYVKHFDKIFVIDGSDDNTEEVIRSYDAVKYFIKDQDLYPKRKICDGVRQFLLEKAQEMYGYEGWFSILHGDEIMVDDPNEVVMRANKKGAEIVNWHSLNFFLHTSQLKQKFTNKKSIQDQIIYYQPGAIEVRQFKNKKGLFYNLNLVSSVLPHGLKNIPLLDYPILKHYWHRFPEYRMNKPNNGVAYWRPDEKRTIKYEECFKDRLYDDYKLVRKYDGSFYELAPGNRPNFFKQWLAWRKYKPIHWGVLEPMLKKIRRI